MLTMSTLAAYMQSIYIKPWLFNPRQHGGVIRLYAKHKPQVIKRHKLLKTMARLEREKGL